MESLIFSRNRYTPLSFINPNICFEHIYLLNYLYHYQVSTPSIRVNQMDVLFIKYLGYYLLLNLEAEMRVVDFKKVQHIRFVNNHALLLIEEAYFSIPFNSESFNAIACLKQNLSLKKIKNNFYACPDHIYSFYHEFNHDILQGKVKRLKKVSNAVLEPG